ncbi:alpha/beta hydrolase [Patescibacteria group bacterium]|nr:alpha/beta hydrolase [Patescibacteria group bacterium]
MSNSKFIEFTTRDGLTLPGLLYNAKKSDEITIYLHGNGSSSVFYDEIKNRALANILNGCKISILFFNNRGAHLIKKLNVKKHGKIERKQFGMAYEKIKECVEDIDGAISFLQKLGYKKFYLIGASTGANKICVYNFYKPKNKVAKYVLLSSGDDAGFYYNLLGKVKFRKLLSRAREKIKTGRGKEIMLELLPYDFIFSYTGFYDIANPDGDYNVFPFYEVIKKVKLSRKPLFRYFKSITKPMLVVYGEKDEYAWGDAKRAVDILKEYKPDFSYEIIKGADHKFDNHKAQLAKTIARWISLK